MCSWRGASRARELLPRGCVYIGSVLSAPTANGVFRAGRSTYRGELVAGSGMQAFCKRQFFAVFVFLKVDGEVFVCDWFVTLSLHGTQQPALWAFEERLVCQPRKKYRMFPPLSPSLLPAVVRRFFSRFVSRLKCSRRTKPPREDTVEGGGKARRGGGGALGRCRRMFEGEPRTTRRYTTPLDATPRQKKRISPAERAQLRAGHWWVGGWEGGMGNVIGLQPTREDFFFFATRCTLCWIEAQPAPGNGVWLPPSWAVFICTNLVWPRVR